MTMIATLLIVGIVLVLLETVLPGMIAGLIGFGCLIAGVYLAYADFGPATGNLVLIGVLVGLLILALLWIRFFPNSPMGRMFITRRTIGNLGVEKPELVNQQGTALTHLRPSGTALIDGKRVDVISEGTLIERGTAVRVIAVEGMRVVVRPC